jgi:hypothetical protein
MLHGGKATSRLAVIAALSACGATTTEASSNEPIHTEDTVVEDTVIEDVSFTPINAGINPDYFALVIRGSVLLGGNPCDAAGNSATLQQSLDGDKVLVVARLERTIDPDRRCTAEWNPVYVTVETVVRERHSLVSDVIVRNVGEIGRDVSAFGRLG